MLTLAQFLQIEDTEPSSEFTCGEVTQKPMPTWDHATIQLYLGSLLVAFLARTGLGKAASEFRCIFGAPERERAFVPDLVVVSMDQLPIERFLYGAPFLAVEILSPDQNRARFAGKIQFFLRYGVELIWVIDPATRTIAVLTPDHEEIILTPGDVLDGGALLPGFSVPVHDIFVQG